MGYEPGNNGGEGLRYGRRDRNRPVLRGHLNRPGSGLCQRHAPGGVEMIAKAYVGKPAQITFTADFHELLEGDLRPGEPVTLRYDPRRIVPAGDPYIFGSPQHPINAFAQFRDEGPVSQEVLTSPAGIVAEPKYDISGSRGSMLAATITVPDDAQRVIIWFSYLAAS